MTALSIVFPDISLCGQMTQCHWPGPGGICRRGWLPFYSAHDKLHSELALHNPLQGQQEGDV